MTMSTFRRQAADTDSKSRIADLQREIDRLVSEYVDSGDRSLMSEAARLSREKENLLKPRIMRPSQLPEAS